MTISQIPITPETDAIITEIEIAAPPERIFHALTSEAELGQWFTNPGCPVHVWKMDSRLGGHYEYQTKQGSVVVNNVDEFKCHGEILEFDPPRLLIYTWIANWHLDKSLRTVVRWELASTPSGTHVKVTHSGLLTETASRKDYTGGWPGVLAMLKQFTECGSDTPVRRL